MWPRGRSSVMCCANQNDFKIPNQDTKFCSVKITVFWWFLKSCDQGMSKTRKSKYPAIPEISFEAGVGLPHFSDAVWICNNELLVKIKIKCKLILVTPVHASKEIIPVPNRQLAIFGK